MFFFRALITAVYTLTQEVKRMTETIEDVKANLIAAKAAIDEAVTELRTFKATVADLTTQLQAAIAAAASASVNIPDDVKAAADALQASTQTLVGEEAPPAPQA